MKLHLINGFLGSGKTTAIIAAARNLIQQGKKVGIVTNDKGRFQVDAAFFQSHQIPTRQVTEGCFRCSFAEFEEKITQLQESTTLDVIFAESVGSCVDLVNTIFPPLQQNHLLNVEKTTYSVFSDIRLFRRWIQHEPLPFSDSINYLFEKQIEETNLLVLNKSDLLPTDQQKDAITRAMDLFPEKIILLQNSLDHPTILPWLQALEHHVAGKLRPGFDVDYRIYKAGEQEMAWLDQKLIFEAEEPEKIRPAMISLVDRLMADLQAQEVFVAHIKLLVSAPGEVVKLSLTTADFLQKPAKTAWAALLPETRHNSLSVMLNARVSTSAPYFAELVKAAVGHVALTSQTDIYCEEGSSYNPVMSLDRP